jgi:hypothetical protein
MRSHPISTPQEQRSKLVSAACNEESKQESKQVTQRSSLVPFSTTDMTIPRKNITSLNCSQDTCAGPFSGKTN